MRVDPENVDTFHFHGGRDALPVTAVIALPHDERSRVLLLGRYTAPDERVQIARPALVMEELLGTVLTVQRYAVAAIGGVAAATLARGRSYTAGHSRRG